LDHVLPGLDGLEVCARLHDLDARVPVVLITGHPDPAIRARARAAGIPLVDKPLAFDALLGLLAPDAAPAPRPAPLPQPA
ncbi:response regulator, partial [Methylobacterium sp.]